MIANKRGFTLIELLVAFAIVGILTALAYPSYQRYVVRTSREAAQTMLIQLAGMQEKIFLNSNAYAVGAGKVAVAYDGTSAGGLGVTAGTTPDGKYTLTSTGTVTTFLLTATPVAGKSQVGDGNITLDESGTRLWGSKSW